MALSASAWLATVTNPNPRERPEFMSVTTVISEASYSAKRSEREASSMPHERFPTYSLTGPSAGAASASSSAAKAVRWNARVWGTRAAAATRPRRAKPERPRRVTSTRAKAGTARDAAFTAALVALPPTDAVTGAPTRARAVERAKAAIFLDIKCQEDASLRTVCMLARRARRAVALPARRSRRIASGFRRRDSSSIGIADASADWATERRAHG